MTALRRGARGFVLTLVDAITALVIAGFLGAAVGQILTDRFYLLSPLMYLPLPLLALMTLAVDLLLRGRTVRGPRFTLAGISLLAIVLQTPLLIGVHSLDDPEPGASKIRIVQWNVMWGGNFYVPSHWDRIEQRLVDQHADVLVLSEIPTNDALSEQLHERLGAGWHVARHDYLSAPFSYMARIRVYSKYPLNIEYRRDMPVATLAVLRLDAPTPLRLMVVDAISGPGDKTLLLRFIADVAREDGGIDIILGDFNAITQSHAFSLLHDLGYRDASAQGAALRPTWPGFLPVFQLDHVMLAPHVRLLDINTFVDAASDHRAHVIDIAAAAGSKIPLCD